VYNTDFPKIASQFKIGDEVSIKWGNQKNAVSGLGKECYPTSGAIVQITKNSFYVRCPAGYVSGASVNHLAVGVEIKKRGVEVVYLPQFGTTVEAQGKTSKAAQQ